MPVMVEFAFFGIWALRPDSDVNRGRQSRTADRGALYKSSSRISWDSLSVANVAASYRLIRSDGH
jgi:hypothetical protein